MLQRTSANEIRGPGGTLPLRLKDEAALDFVMLIEGETSGVSLDEVLPMVTTTPAACATPAR